MLKNFGLPVRSRLPYISLLVLALITLCPQAASAQAVRDDLWVTNGTVYDAKAVGDTLYVGGQFDFAGPATGPFGVADAAAGAVETGWPKITGVVYAVAPDGAGGWYVGGKFSSVGGVTIYNLAHIRADKTLDTAWNPNPSHAPYTDDVKDIEVAGGVVYVCGSFTEIGGQQRKGLAALDAATGAAAAWNPNPSGKVFKLEVIGDRLYVGGAITAVGLSARGGAAAFDLSTGALLAWNPSVSGNANNVYTGVHAFAASGNTVFLGGLFTSAAGQARNGLAAVDATTGAALAWNPNPLGDSGRGALVEALAVDGSTVYVGGRFNEIGGLGVTRLAAVDATTGAVSPNWTPNPSPEEGHLVDYGDLHVSALTVADGVVYAAGGFKLIGGEARRGLAALDTATGAAKPFRADSNRPVLDFALQGGRVAAVGDFMSIGGVRRRNLAAFDLATGRATDWNPDTESSQPLWSVRALATDGGPTLYVAGSFERVGGKARKGLAEVNRATGVATDWRYSGTGDPPSNVSDLEVTPTALYVAGGFTVYNGTAQLKNLVSLRRTTGALAGFAPQPDGGVAEMAIYDGALYAAGSFRNIGGQQRIHVAAFDLSTHALRGWKTGFNPDSNLHMSGASALAVANGRVFVGGHLPEVLESPSPGAPPAEYGGTVVAFNVSDGRLVKSWFPAPNFYVEEIEVVGATCYLGGSFWAFGAEQQPQFAAAAVHAETGELAEWTLFRRSEYSVGSGVVEKFVVKDGLVYVGGAFKNILGSGHSYIAGVSQPELSNVAPTTGLSVTVGGVASVAPATVAARVGATVTLTAAPHDVDGSIAAVEFYAGATLLGRDESAPYTLTKGDFAAGEYQIKAVATDDRGGTGDSAPVHLTVLAPEASLSVSGRVLDQEGLALAGVTVRLAGARSATAVTDALGNYSFANLQPNEAYAVMPSLADYDFRPEGFEYPSLAANESAHFIAYRQVSASQYASNLWVPNGAVRAAVVKGETLYIGGDFTRLRGIGEHGATVSTQTGAVDQRFGRLDGKIYAAAPDGAGGWYVGGTFTSARVGEAGVERRNLARLLPDGSLDETWNPSANGKVSALAVVGATLYVGGQFTEVGGQPRAGLAALNRATGAPTAWDPALTLTARRAYQPVAVNSLLVDGSRLFVGGLFDLAGGVERVSLAQFDISGATPALTEWTAGLLSVGGQIRALGLSAATRTLYAGGLAFFDEGQQGKFLSALDADTGARRALFDPPKPGGDITSLAVHGNTLYLAGEFTGFYVEQAGSTTTVFRRGGFASLDATTGALTDWHPRMESGGQGPGGSSMFLLGSTLYVGGNFTHVGGEESVPATPSTPRAGLAAYDAGTGSLLDWNPVTGGYVTAFAVNGTTLFVGSSPASEGVERKHLAAINVNTGQPTGWNPGADGPVYDLSMGDTTVFVAGRFKNIGGARHLKVAEVELSTARATEWNPSAHLDKFADPIGGPFEPTPAPHVTINEIAVAGGRVLLGGKFDSADADLNRPALLAVSRATGLVENWDGGFAAGSEVRELLVDGETVYVGGKFGTVGGQARANLAAFDLPTAQLKPWSPAVRLAGGAAGAHVAALVIAGGSLYVGGDFDEVGGQARKDLAEVSLQTGLPASWNPAVKDPTAGDASHVEALTVTGSLVYVGGNFGLVGEAERRGLAAVNRTTGLASAWDPRVEGGDVLAITASTFGGKIFTGGSFTGALGLGAGRAYLIGVRNPDPSSLNVAPQVEVHVENGVMESGRPMGDGGGTYAPESQGGADTGQTLHSVHLTADALDVDGQVSRVEFYHGATFIGSDASAPFNTSWLNVEPGTYALTARALDNRGVATTSRPLNITIGSQPQPTPTPTPGPTPTPVPVATPTPTPVPTTSLTNFALASNGGVATASSTTTQAELPGLDFSPAGVINGDRKGLNWEHGGGWRDATNNAFPDWVQVDFNGAKSISEVGVFSLQDGYTSPAEPTEALTFTKYGVTAFEVQYWDGVGWATVPGASVAGNNKVWRKLSFSPVTTTKLRVVVRNALAGRSRLVEVEAWGTAAQTTPPPGARINAALASNGGVATASSTTTQAELPGLDFSPAGVINGDRKGLNWEHGGGWRDATNNAFPDWLEVAFAAPTAVDEIGVFSLQDGYASPAEPTEAMTFTKYGVTVFEAQYWDGSGWATVPGGSVTNNGNVWRRLTFPAVTTTKVRVVVSNALAGRSRLVEVEAWGVPASARVNHAASSNGGAATASSTTPDSEYPGLTFPVASVINGDRRGLNWERGGGWRDATVAFPDWLQVEFNGAKKVDEVGVFSLQDNYASPSEPTEALAFTKYGVTSFQVQYWDGAQWVTVPGGTITGNTLVWRKVTFPQVTTTKVRVVVNGAMGGRSRLVEVEARGPAS